MPCKNFIIFPSKFILCLIIVTNPMLAGTVVNVGAWMIPSVHQRHSGNAEYHCFDYQKYTRRYRGVTLLIGLNLA